MPNALIALQGKGFNPLEIDQQIAQTQHAEMQNRLAQFGMEQKQQEAARQGQLRNMLASGADASALTRGGFLKEGMDWTESNAKVEKERAEAKYKGSQTAKSNFDLATAQLSTTQQELSGLLADPNLSYETAAAVGKRLVDRGIADPAQMSQLIAQLPRDPQGLRQSLATFRSQLLTAQQHIQDQREKERMAETQRHNRTSEGLTASGQAITMSGQDMVDSRAREANAAAMSKPFEVSGPDGNPMLVQQDKQGNIKPVEGYTPKAAKLKDIPPAQNAAIIENTKALQNIDAAIEAIKKNPGSLGALNYLGDAVRQRTDPDGVSARAMIANIGGQRFHDLSGAAITVTEANRLKPFIPAATDSRDVAIQKLENLRQEYSNVNGMLSSTYSKEQGYKPSPVRAPETAKATGAFADAEKERRYQEWKAKQVAK